MKYLHDIKLSLKAKGLLSYLLEINDSTITAKRLSLHLKESEKTISGILRELVKSRYVTREQNRQDNGTWGSYTYNFYSEPQQENSTEPKSKKDISGAAINKINNDFDISHIEDETIIWYMERMKTKIDKLISYKDICNLFKKYGYKKVKEYYFNIDKLDFNTHAGIQSFKSLMDKNTLENVEIYEIADEKTGYYKTNKKCKCGSYMSYMNDNEDMECCGFVCNSCELVEQIVMCMEGKK